MTVERKKRKEKTFSLFKLHNLQINHRRIEGKGNKLQRVNRKMKSMIGNRGLTKYDVYYIDYLKCFLTLLWNIDHTC